MHSVCFPNELTDGCVVSVVFHCSQSDTANNTQMQMENISPLWSCSELQPGGSGEEAELHWATDLAALTKKKTARGQEAGGPGSNNDWLRGKQAARLLSVTLCLEF